MPLVARKFGKIADVNAHLIGKLVGGVDIFRNSGSLYLHGLTLIFTTPAATVTFAASPAAAQVPLTPAQVKTQIEAQTTNGVLVSFRDGHVELIASPSGTLVLGAAGTANAMLGFMAGAASTVKPVTAPGGAAPSLVSIGPDTGSNGYILMVNE